MKVRYTTIKLNNLIVKWEVLDFCTEQEVRVINIKTHVRHFITRGNKNAI